MSLQTLQNLFTKYRSSLKNIMALYKLCFLNVLSLYIYQLYCTVLFYHVFNFYV